MSIELIAEVLATSLIASAASWAVVIYLSKTMLSHKLAEALENHKAELTRELEGFKLSLGKDLHRFSVEHSRLDQQRTSGAMEIHGLMCEIEQLVIWSSGPAATALISVTPEARTIEALNKAWEGIAKLDHSLSYHALLFPDELYHRVQQWSKQMMVLVSRIGNEIESLRKQAPPAGSLLAEREGAITAIRDKHLDGLLSDIGATRKELGVELKRLLGAPNGG